MPIRPYTNRRAREARRTHESSGFTTSTRGDVYSSTIQSMARRYGKKKKRMFRLPAAKIRSAVLGSMGSADQASDPPDP